MLLPLVLALGALRAQTTTTTGTTTDTSATTATTATTPTAATTTATTSSVIDPPPNTILTSALVVYKLTFETAGETINYRPYQGGYYIAPITGGTGSLILTLTTGGVKQFYTYSNFGELFVAVKGQLRKTVLSATAANTVSTTTFFAIGNANDRIPLESRSIDGDVFAAKHLTGYAVSADSERDLPYASSAATDIGVAGVSFLRATLDEGKTSNAIDNSRSLADQVTIVQEELTEDGYVSGQTTNATSTGNNANAANAANASNASTGTSGSASGTSSTTGTTAR